MTRSALVVLLLSVSASCTYRIAQYGATAPRKPAPENTAIVLLGTGTPNPDPDRSGPAVAIIVNGTPYLVDCGAGVIRRAAAAYKAGTAGLEVGNIKHLFVTHLHSDHTLGYPDVILTPWVDGRDQPLQVFGPAGIGAMTDHILQAYDQDIRVRIDGLQPINTVGYKVNVHEIEPGVVYKDANVTVRAFPVKHGSWAQAFGFRFDTPDRSIVISGDTVPTQTLVDSAKGCDVLIHEVYSEAGFKKRSPEWQRYHSSSHTSSRELARIAKEVQPGLLILYHQLFWGSTEEELLSEIRQIYRGPVVSGKDLEVY
ncbi:MAG: MBL fold metallo-hydrolase [Phycisphaerales bacterium]|nr:MAG: MBL fold metallo-hydrolase [Phycisphaerales bacterium]